MNDHIFFFVYSMNIMSEIAIKTSINKCKTIYEKFWLSKTDIYLKYIVQLQKKNSNGKTTLYSKT